MSMATRRTISPACAFAHGSPPLPGAADDRFARFDVRSQRCRWRLGDRPCFGLLVGGTGFLSIEHSERAFHPNGIPASKSRKLLQCADGP
ncbi:MAG: hypothetical protein ACLP41_04615 [Acidimicrobiales bacterium]